ncbi:sigma-70 family RNA polymerase sigma factor [Chamaesiphon polymorphus]|uniref:Uncharacterized protein n=1 Tax=Chamaesiphon polymorphus CCALA 037 TaxID=2107692 RepID=A0A2T1GIP4_9CYAN|nr:sigma-70 family RNA polymerase sigma factor [Chamaesiphon polymorphus]PSB57648.1 hypothetical protein C7B77_07675 [Chamaesiphon polymorphus CCALA 037]
MPLNPLSIFYSVPRWELDSSGYIRISWQCDSDAIPAISRAGNFQLSGISLANLEQVNTYIDRLLIADRQLTTVVVTNLYRIALAQQNLVRNNCWFNFIRAMTVKAALHTWQKVPTVKQNEELFERLVTPSLSIRQLLTSFKPEYHPDLLVGLQAWTYNAVRYNSFAYLRANGDPYFGLSNLGVVSRSSGSKTRAALMGNITTDRLNAELSMCKIFKNYLGRSRIRVDRLTLENWQDILAEARSLGIDISIEELRTRLDRVGNLIRTDANPTIERYDDPNAFIAIEYRVDTPELEIDTVNANFIEIFKAIERFISDLPAESQQIVTLRHQQNLKQGKIAKIIAKDQSKVSRKLGEIYLELLDFIHTQIPHPTDGRAQKNSQAIVAVKHLLDKYFRQVQPVGIT